MAARQPPVKPAPSWTGATGNVQHTPKAPPSADPSSHKLAPRVRGIESMHPYSRSVVRPLRRDRSESERRNWLPRAPFLLAKMDELYTGGRGDLPLFLIPEGLRQRVVSGVQTVAARLRLTWQPTQVHWVDAAITVLEEQCMIEASEDGKVECDDLDVRRRQWERARERYLEMNYAALYPSYMNFLESHSSDSLAPMDTSEAHTPFRQDASDAIEAGKDELYHRTTALLAGSSDPAISIAHDSKEADRG